MSIGLHTCPLHVVFISDARKIGLAVAWWNLVCCVKSSETNFMQRSDQSGSPRLPLFTLDKVMRSDPIAVDDAVSEITAALKSLDWCDDIDLVALAIHETLTNALVHGNRCDPEKTIGISVTLNHDGSLLATVKDSGSGFDPNLLPNPLAAENLLSNHGRGIFLIRQVMDKVEFDFDHGTEVRMCRRQKWLE
jgi:anti-sigma regulatory factor (Ser/Thr protein kinase)